MAITTTSTTVVGVFDSSEQAERAVRELTQSGVSRDDISLVANDQEGRWSSVLGQSSTSTGSTAGTNESEVGRDTAIGAGIGALGGLLLGLGALAIPGIGPVIAAGPLMGMLGGAAVGAAGGGLVGLLRDQGIPDDDANLYAESVRRGGTLVTVHANNGRTDEICRILDRNGAVDVEERGRTYRDSGWNRFDDSSSQYSGGTLGIGGMGGGTQTPTSTTGATSRERRSQSTGSQASAGTTGSVTGASRSGTESGERRGTFSRVYAPSGMGSGYSGSRPGLDWDDIRQHWQSNYSTSGSDFESYRGAYEFGGRSARDTRYSGRSWDDVQDTLRTDYLRNNPNSTWDNVKGAVRYGWEKMTGKRD
ncbi:MAG: general stress protein [Bryobacteraceae bacterium]|nr:general stress protein [Bryobacteraceae bacterium]